MSDNVKLNDEALDAVNGAGWESVDGFKAKQWVEQTVQHGPNGQVIGVTRDVMPYHVLPGGGAERWDVAKNAPVRYR